MSEATRSMLHPDALTKQEEFLWLVQTTVLANAINQRHETMNVFVVMDEALRASRLIPDNIAVRHAAEDFCIYMLPNLRAAREKALGAAMKVPFWFAR